MSGTELDPDGTDSYHPNHPWEQTTHPLYIPPNNRSRENWPPVNALPAGPYEESEWLNLPAKAPAKNKPRWFGPDHREEN